MCAVEDFVFCINTIRNEVYHHNTQWFTASVVKNTNSIIFSLRVIKP